MILSRFLKCLSVLALVGSLVDFSQADSIRWSKSYKAALAASKSSGKIIMIDMYTDWCQWCKVLDQKTYPDSRVVAAARNFTSVKVDAEREGTSLAARYGVHTYPKILFLDSKENLVYVVSGYQPPERFAVSMKSAQKSLADGRKYTATLAHNPSDLNALAVMAGVSLDREQFDKAQGYLQRAQTSSPKAKLDKLAEAYMNFGGHFYQEKDMGSAVNCFEKATMKAKSPQTIYEANVNLAALLYQTNRRGEAIGQIQNAIKNPSLSAKQKGNMKKMLGEMQSH